MRVITGALRGKKLKTLDGLDTRPTTDMVKEAIFSAIQFDVQGSRCIDLFAGSGQMGIEALSRGATFCAFVDQNPAAVEVVKANIESCGLQRSSKVFNFDSLDYLKSESRNTDIIFMDPPYGQGILQKALPLCTRLIDDGGIVVCEHEKELFLEESYGRLKLHKRYKYGKIAVTIFRVPDGLDEEEDA